MAFHICLSAEAASAQWYQDVRMTGTAKPKYSVQCPVYSVQYKVYSVQLYQEVRLTGTATPLFFSYTSSLDQSVPSADCELLNSEKQANRRGHDINLKKTTVKVLTIYANFFIYVIFFPLASLQPCSI